MAPKCARLLSHARPSASADAISHLGARAVSGPWPEGRKRDPGWVHQRVLDAYAGQTVSCSTERSTCGRSRYRRCARLWTGIVP